MPHYPEGSTITREDSLTRIMYPRGERHVIDAAQFATFDQRDARIAGLWSALYRIRVLAGDAAALEGIDRETLFAAIRDIAAGALISSPERDMQTVSEELGY